MNVEDLNDNDSLEIALLDARMWIVKAESENQLASYETSREGWLSDHTAAAESYMREYEKAISRAQAFVLKQK